MEIVVIVVSSFINFINLCQNAYRFQFKYFYYYGTKVISRPAELRSNAFAPVITTWGQKLNSSWKRRKNLILGFVITTGWSLLCFARTLSLKTWINWSSTWQGKNHLISVVYGEGRFAMWCGLCSALDFLFWLRVGKFPVPSVRARWLTEYSQKHEVLVDYFSKMKVCKNKSRGGLWKTGKLSPSCFFTLAIVQMLRTGARKVVGKLVTDTLPSFIIKLSVLQILTFVII